MSLCASVRYVLCLPIAKHGVVNAIIKGRNTSHSEYIEDWQVSRSRWWGCVQSKPTPRCSVLCFPWLYSLSVVSWENEIMERKAEGSTYPCHDCRTPGTNAAMEKAEKNTPTSMRCCEINVGGWVNNVECLAFPFGVSIPVELLFSFYSFFSARAIWLLSLQELQWWCRKWYWYRWR